MVTELNTMEKSYNSTFLRAKTLLKSAYDLLKKQDDNYAVLNLLAETVFYDEAECDGSCLMDDIEYWFDEIGQNIREEIG